MKKLISIAATFIIGFIFLNSFFYVLEEGQQAIVVQFGKPVSGSLTESGLKFKLPIIQDVIKFEKRLLEWDGDANEIPTKDNKYIFIDAFARWKITDPLKFYKNVKNENLAQSRLDDIIDGSVRDEISNRVMEEIIKYTDRPMIIADAETRDATMMTDSMSMLLSIKGARMEIVNSILTNVSAKMLELDMGIEVVDIMLKRINYNQQVQVKLFDRMVSEQNRIAEKYRAQGQGEKQNIIGMTKQKKQEILSQAYLESQTIKGKADAEATNIYAKAYNRSPDFYKFIKTLETYENSIDPTTTLILSTDNDYLKYLDSKR